jgi:ubiquinone/menaquinone biosynthesis C-methylase UbiE
MAAMEEFLSDYPQGMDQGRYVDGELPHLPFGDAEFDLAICSHLLFLYSEQLTKEFHIASIKELCRVASEVRGFPLLELGARKSRHLQTIMNDITAEGYSVTIVPVPYEFQRGGNQMMKITGIEPRHSL